MNKEPRIPALTGSATTNQARAYLIWLAGSQFAYHIDDSVSYIAFGGLDYPTTEEERNILEGNEDAMYSAFSAEYGAENASTEMWHVYGMAKDVYELMTDGFPNLEEETCVDKVERLSKMASTFKYANA